MTKEKVPKPVISVVMPVYNVERFLRESIESVLNQSFGEFEFIIINDGSLDSTSEILNSFSDNRIRLIERENRGFASSLNEGISLSNGKYIARVDGDDINLPNRFELQYKYMELHPDVDILGGQAWNIDESGNIIGERIKPVSAEDISRLIEYNCPVIHPTYFVRKYVFEVLHGYRDLAPADDYDLLFRALEHRFKIENISEKIIKYRLNPHGMSMSNIMRSRLYARYVLKMHKNRIKGKGNDEKVIAFLKSIECKTSRWFNFCYNVRSYFLQHSKSRNIFTKYTYLSIAFLVSMMHYEIFLCTLRKLSQIIHGYGSY